METYMCMKRGLFVEAVVMEAGTKDVYMYDAWRVHMKRHLHARIMEGCMYMKWDLFVEAVVMEAGTRDVYMYEKWRVNMKRDLHSED